MQNPIKKYSLVFFFPFLFMLVFQAGINAPAWAARAEMVDFVVIRARDYVYVDAKLKGAFTSGVNEAIASGIPTTFRYYIELVKPRSLWFDKRSGHRLIEHNVAYDTLKKEYQIIMDDGVSPQVRVTKNEEEMKRWMASLVSVRFLPSRKVPSGRKYRIRLKAEMKGIKMPFPLNYLLYYLISFLDFDTPWITSRIPAAVSDKSAMNHQISAP